MCGRGKTSWAIQYMNEHPDKSYVYVTPLLDEVDRIKAATRIGFVEPEPWGKRKIDDFNDLLCEGRNIATTHVTFSNSTDLTVELIQQGEYVLFLDEVLDVVVPYNDTCSDPAHRMNPGDINMLLGEKLIAADEYGRVSWIGHDYDDCHYQVVRQMANRGNLVLVNNTLFLWEFPIDVFKAFKEVYVLTYLFSGSMMKPFLEYHGLPYEMYNAVRDGERYAIAAYAGDDADRGQYKQLIHLDVPSGHKMNDYKGSALSKNWYKSRARSKDAPDAKQLKNHAENYIRNFAKVKSDQVMWTCTKDFAKRIAGKGFTQIRRLTAEEKKLPQREQDKLKCETECFVPCNARATNVYRGRTTLMYLHNMYANPNLTRFFEKKGITIDNNAYALSSFIQWTWRSAIRDGKEISLYIPSTRMRNLFENWLDPESAK